MRTLSFALMLLGGTVLAGSILPNGNFDTPDGAGGALNWSHNEKGTYDAAGGVGGSAAAHITQDGDRTWRNEGFVCDENETYLISFKARSSATGQLQIRFYWDELILWSTPANEWTSYSSIVRTHVWGDRTFESSLGLGTYQFSGDVWFDDVAVTPVTARWTSCGDGIELGPGEMIEGNQYRFSAHLDGDMRMDCRPLAIHNGCFFNTYRWSFGSGSYVQYSHQIGSRHQSNATLTLFCGYEDGGGSLAVEASTDGSSWTRIGTVDHEGTHAFAIPASVVSGAGSVYIRLRGEAGTIQISGYNFESTLDGAPLSAVGGAEYADTETGEVLLSVGRPEIYEESFGEVLPQSTAALGLWTASSARKVGRSRSVPTNRVDGISLRTAANEAESVQLVCRPTAALRDARVEPTALTNAAGGTIPASAIRVERVGYVPVTQNSDSTGCPGLWPDPLLPQTAGDFAVEAGENQPFWVTVKPPKGTSAGTYSGTLRVRATDAAGTTTERDVAFSVEVFGFDLPDVMTCETAFGLSFNHIYARHGVSHSLYPERSAERDTIWRTYLETIAPFHTAPYNPSPNHTPWYDLTKPTSNPEDAVLTWHFDDWDEWMEYAFTNLHFNAFNAYPWCIWNCQGWDFYINGYKEGTPEFDAYTRKAVKGYEDHIREKGWLDKAYFYYYDEPTDADYPYVKHGLDLFAEYGPGFRRMLTEPPCAELMDEVNIWCPQPHTLHAPGEATARAQGDTFWWYLCMNPFAPYATLFIDHPGIDLRVWLWQSWAERVTGVLIWEMAWWYDFSSEPVGTPRNPYQDSMSYADGGGGALWGNGDGRLLYPPLTLAATNAVAPCLEAPNPCQRLAMLRDGIEDYEYFAMLSRLLAARTDLSPASRAEYEALLQVPADVSESLVSFSADSAPMEAHRIRLARAIEALSAFPKPVLSQCSMTGTTFTIPVANPVSNAWYTVFTAESVAGPYVAEADSVRYESGPLSLSTQANRPSKFVRIGVSPAQIHQGAPLP